jgi:N-acetylneuraminate synthase/N,N'-diacetyllegionaminate synthase
VNKVKSIKIGRQMVGPEQPTYIIAEAGVNHNGDVGRAKELIDLAAKAGADVVKFQTFFAENIVTRKADRAKYQKANMPGVDETQWQMLKKLELDKKAFLQLRKYADSKGILFLSTPYDEDSIDLLFDIGVAAFKVSSAWITNLPFLRHMAKKGLPIIFSRGMSYQDEIEEAIKTLKEAGNDQLILLHCHFNYPTDFKDINLNMIKTIKNEFGLVTGFSDHTPGITAPIAAVALGADVIEKHFTLDKSLPGPDHKASLDPDELKAMIKGIREVEQALGTAKITVTENEAPMREVSRTSLVSTTDIKAGTMITKKMVAIKRPGTGIRPRHFKDVIGRKTTEDIPADTVIELKVVEGLSDIKDLKVGNKPNKV